MSIVSTPMRLASGQLSNTKATLYTVPSNKATSLLIVFYNTDTGSRTCYSFVNDGTSRQFSQSSVAANGNNTSVCTLTLNAGDLVEGYADVGSKVNYFIFGVEKTLS